MPGVLALIGVILLVLAGVNVGGPRFNPLALGLAFVFLAALWGPISGIAS